MTVTRLLSVRHGLSGEASTVQNAMMPGYALQPWLFIFPVGCLDGWTLLNYMGGERRVQAMVGQATKLILCLGRGGPSPITKRLLSVNRRSPST